MNDQDFNVEDYIESTLSRSNTATNTNNISSNIDSFIKKHHLFDYNTIKNRII